MFLDVFKEVIHFANCLKETEIGILNKYLAELCEYVLFDGKQNRAKTVINTYKHLSKPKEDPVKIKEAHVLGCCIEILQAGFLVHDDIMDESETRRKKRCWHLISKDKGYGLIAVNDGIYLNSLIYKVLKHYFRNKPYYVDLVDLFNDSTHSTCVGQCLDSLTSSRTTCWNYFNEPHYKELVKLKTTKYSYYLPVASAMILAGETDEKLFSKAEEILVEIGEYFQIQDDYLDCYSDLTVFGKSGNDIQENKCSWLVIQALKRTNESQINRLKEHYGNPDLHSVQIVKDTYRELDLQGVYARYEDEQYAKVMRLVDGMEEEDGKKLPKEIFIDLLNQIYKRNK